MNKEHYPEEPYDIEEALNSSEASDWMEAVQSELNPLQNYATWTVTKCTEGIKALPTRLVLKRKYDSIGNICRHKARLVVRGFFQGNTDNTFAPVVDFNTVRIVLTIAVWKGHYIHQMDVRTAFLHGKIEEDVCIKPPKGLDLCKEDEVLKLNRGYMDLNNEK